MHEFDADQAGDSFEHWHQVTCRNYSLTECRPKVSGTFRGHASVRPFGEVAISHVGTQLGFDDALKVVRTRSEIRRDFRDDFFIWIGRSGSTLIEQEGRTVQLLPGDICLQDQAAPFSLTFSRQWAAAMIIVPRDLMLAQLPDATQCVAMRLPGHSPVARLASAMELEAQPWAPATGDPVHQKICNASLDIWVSAVQASRPVDCAPGTPASQDTRLLAAQRYLQKHLRDPELDLATAAAELHVSTRTLLRLFAIHGATPMGWLSQQRLIACKAALERRQFQHVSDAAYAHGFVNLSHFSRAFKALHKVTPQQVLRGVTR